MTPQEFFKQALFAENAGVVLLEVREGYSKAKLEIKPEHLNAGARTQGGAIFTLADLALAAAANSHGTLAFSLSSSITFLRASGPEWIFALNAAAADARLWCRASKSKKISKRS